MARGLGGRGFCGDGMRETGCFKETEWAAKVAMAEVVEGGGGR